MITYKPIPDYEGIYEAGSDGTIWSCEGKTTTSFVNGKARVRTWKRRKLKPKKEKRGRSTHFDFRVELWKNGQHRTMLVARLVAMAFIPNPNNYPCVNHINGDTLKNTPENLEWCTYSENIKRAHKTGLNKSPNGIVLIDKTTGEKFNFTSMSEAGLFMGLSIGYVSNRFKKGKPENDKYIFKIKE